MQPSNIESIFTKLSGNLIVFREIQFENAPLPISFILSPNVTDSNNSLPEKAHESIFSKISGKIIFLIFASENA